ncbi:chlorohydrolase family protein [Jannaschia seohaensis]|uniref:Cytosine/adenosine deaminase n=1 Tax=Jannaschia seohaensis TaxID=475081 RepID=A0A2Y8ZZY2_9RHOB|nr:chlorohydrolase family protein [Jannaschia seohaensis]PWJ21633.1 cytosine/adenosine deaminase-related metal-dependent hydrolase [Jannaschia seohaensis]SSA37694.1 Cytosine/adenosine deaminase [Jannaschia seohaensis]
MTRTLLTARWVVGFGGDAHRVHENGCVLIEADRVAHIGALPDPVPDCPRIDYGEAILSPGFIDLDALSDLDTTILGLDNFPGWKKGRVWPESYVARGPYEMYSAEELAFQKRFAFASLIRNGITTALPIASLFYREWGETVEEFEAAAEAAEALGLRVYLGPAYRTGGQVVDESGTIRAIYDEARGLAGLEEAADFAQRIEGRAEGRIRAMFAPDRIETCTPKLLRRTAAIAAEMGAPVRQHCLQSEIELRLVRDQHGVSPIRFLAENGALASNWLLPHGTNATEEDIALIRDAGAALVHCPLVAARHGGMLRSLPRWLEAGITVGMGTDTWPPDMILNMQLGLMTARLADGHDAIRSEALFDAATLGGARALGRDDIGRLAPGAKADIAVIDLSGALQTPDPIQTLMTSCAGRDVRDVWIDGRRVMADGVIPGSDLVADTARAQAQFDGLVAKYPDRTLGHPPMNEIFEPSYERVTHDRHRP